MAAAVEPVAVDVVPAERAAEEDEVKNKKKSKEPPEPTASYRELFQYLSPAESFWMVVAFIFSCIHGAAQPMMMLAFREMIDLFGTGSMMSGAVISMDAMLRPLFIMVIIGAAMGVGQGVSASIINIITASMMLKYKREYLKAVLRQDVGWYDVSNPEELTTMFQQSMAKMQKGFKSLPMFFMGISYGAGGAVLAFLPSLGNAEIAGVTFGTVIFLIAAISFFMYVMENGDKVVSKAYAKAGGIASECLFSMRTITSLGIERTFEKRYTGALSSVRRSYIQMKIAEYVGIGFTFTAYLLMMVVATAYGAFRLAGEVESSQFDLVVPDESVGDVHYCADASGEFTGNYQLGTPCQYPLQMTCQMGEFLALAGTTTLGQIAAATPGTIAVPDGYTEYTMLEALGFSGGLSALDSYVTGSHAPAAYLADNPNYYSCMMKGANILICVFALMMMGEGFGMSGQPFVHLNLARQAAAQVFKIVNRVPAIDSFSEEGTKLESVSGTIEVKDVTFAYPSSIDHPVCKGYSLHIPAGATVALCGPSGSGKSTIIQLIERFYDPQSGVVMLDGVDIKTLNVRWLRSQLGLVLQEPMLFQGSVSQNIGYGKPSGDATQAEIEEAATMANAHGFITESLGEGYSTQVGQGGNKLSGGQKQRVAIARALIKKPTILLLDEATSALDSKSEKVVQAALDEIMTKQKRTTVVIAHRLTTIRNADKIAVLKDGAVHEEGTHDELMQISGGIFRGLAEKQEELLAMDKKAIAGGGAEASEGPAAGATLPEAGPEVVQAEVVGAAGEAEKGKKAKEPSAPIGRLLSLQADQALSLLLMALCTGAGAGLSTFSFLEMTEIMNVVFNPNPANMRSDTISICIRLLIFAGAMIGSLVLAGVFNGLSSSALTQKLRTRGVASLMRQDMGFYDQEENSAGELTAFLEEKVNKVKVLTSEQLDIVSQLIGGFGAFIAVCAWKSDWRILLAWIGGIVIIGAVSPLQAAFMKGEDAQDEMKKKGKEDTSKLGVATNSGNKIIGDAVWGIRTVASFNLEHFFFDNYTKSAMTVSTLQKRDATVGGFVLGITMFIMMAVFGAIFFYSIWLTTVGASGLTAAFAPMMCLIGVMMPMMKIGAMADLPTAKNSAIRLFKLFDREPAIDNLSEEGTKLESVTGVIEVKDVVFAYPTATDHLVCKGYSLSVPAGATVALCGPSGSGKSTIISLLERFYDPQSGVVMLDGVDIKTLNVRWLRAQFGYVGQEPVLFQGSIAQNIGYGKPSGDATQAEIEEAATMANAHGFITTNLADGYRTDVGLKGGKLSGGQKQRVAIARAIIRKPPVLLLDEATSALDNESERIVQAALDEIMTKQKRTTVVIAHRLTTIRNADKIAVVNEGKIVEQGTHDELLAMGKEGMYSNLVMAA